MATHKQSRSGKSSARKTSQTASRNQTVSRKLTRKIVERGNLTRAFDLLTHLPAEFDAHLRADDKPQRRKGL